MEVVGTGCEFGHNDDYQRAAEHYVKDGTLIYDDVNEFEPVKKFQPQISSTSRRMEKYVFFSVPADALLGLFRPLPRLRRLCDLRHRDMDVAINSPIWKKTKAPWKQVPEVGRRWPRSNQVGSRLFRFRKSRG